MKKDRLEGIGTCPHQSFLSFGVLLGALPRLQKPYKTASGSMGRGLNPLALCIVRATWGCLAWSPVPMPSLAAGLEVVLRSSVYFVNKGLSLTNSSAMLGFGFLRCVLLCIRDG